MPLEYDNDLLTAGKIVALEIMLEIKNEDKTLDDIDLKYIIEEQKRNLNDPSVLENLGEQPEGGE
jgi:hypothetical protein